jgi:hypothetical protein
MSIIDTFPYLNEKELLELRINLLNDHIDKFLIIDANRTHKGANKPFTCKDTLKDLGLFTDKIQVIELDLPSYIEAPNPWVRERMQRNAAAKFISENDISIVSDCDEIIDPNYIEYYIDIAKKHPNNILRIPMVLLNCRGDLIVCDENNNEKICASPFFCLNHHLNGYTLSDIRESNAYGNNNIKYKDIFTTENNIIDKAGWHFSWMGDENRLKNKYEAFAHGHEVNLIDNYIPKEDSTDLLGRKDHILKKYDIVNLPSKIFELPNVKKFLGLKNKISHVYQKPEFGEDWFSYKDLYKEMVSKFNDNSVFIEIGSWKGKSSAYMATEIANSNKNITFICIDTWLGSEEHQNNKELNNLYGIFLSNMQSLKEHYQHLRMSSLDAAKLFPNESIDFVFIDASHEYEDVKADILAWIPKIKSGGILAGHEIFKNFQNRENCFVVNI